VFDHLYNDDRKYEKSVGNLSQDLNAFVSSNEDESDAENPDVGSSAAAVLMTERSNSTLFDTTNLSFDADTIVPVRCR
jgi:hypothetical protein